MTNIYEQFVLKPNGEKVYLSEFKNKVILIVNTATGCGFTPQYKDLEDMYKKYHNDGLEIIDIPCNQFANQTPESDEEIHKFCTLHYNTTFPQMKKSDVNGENQLELYKFLKSKKTFETFGTNDMAKRIDEMLRKFDKDYDKNPDIKWNFTKFLIDRKGNVVYRFEPTEDMKNIEEKVKELL